MIDHASLSKRGGRRYGSLGQGAARWVRSVGTSATVAAVTTVFNLQWAASNTWALKYATSTALSLGWTRTDTASVKWSE